MLCKHSFGTSFPILLTPCLPAKWQYINLFLVEILELLLILRVCILQSYGTLGLSPAWRLLFASGASSVHRPGWRGRDWQGESAGEAAAGAGASAAELVLKPGATSP